MNAAISPRLAAGLAAAALLAVGCGPARTSHTTSQPAIIPALASGDGATASMGLAAPAYPVVGRVEYRVQGSLPSLPGNATAYTLGRDATGAQVARLASALGVGGTPTSDAQGWVVASTSSSLRVERSPGLPWQLGRVGGGEVAISGCAVAVPGRPAGSPGAALPPAFVPPPSPCPSPTPVAGLPSRAEAEQRAESALRAAGLVTTGATLASSGGITEWFVTVTPTVGGVPISGAGWSLAVGPQGVLLFGSGWLATPSSRGDHPLVGVQAGLDRLRTGGRWILRGGPGPVPLLGGAAGGLNSSSSAGSAPAAAPAAQPAPPVAPIPLPVPTRAGPPAATPAPIPPTVLTVTGVHLALAWGTPVNGTGVAWLVPVYVFELSGGGAVPVLAVADGLVATPAPPIPPGVKILPAPAPVEPPVAPATPNG